MICLQLSTVSGDSKAAQWAERLISLGNLMLPVYRNNRVVVVDRFLLGLLLFSGNVFFLEYAKGLRIVALSRRNVYRCALALSTDGEEWGVF